MTVQDNKALPVRIKEQYKHTEIPTPVSKEVTQRRCQGIHAHLRHITGIHTVTHPRLVLAIHQDHTPAVQYVRELPVSSDMELPGNIPDCRTVELIMKELEHSGFKNLVLITDRGYESMKNLELYISKAKPVARKRGRPAKPKVENQEL